MLLKNSYSYKCGLLCHTTNRVHVMVLACFLVLSSILSSTAYATVDEDLHFTILYTNDEHGAVIPHSPTVDFHPSINNPTIGGYARLASMVNEIRDNKKMTNEPVLLLSAGDFIGGSPYSWLIPQGYALELELKQMIGYDAVTIGNHEYDYGPDILAQYLQTAGYPQAHNNTVVLASNTVAPPEHPLARQRLYQDHALVVLDNGLKVGLFGLIGKQAISYTTANEPVSFLDQHDTARKMVETLKGQGADLIIVITHSRVEEDIELARDIEGINVIVGGHCHTELHQPLIENGTIIVQAGSKLSHLGMLELAFNPDSGELRILNDKNNQSHLIALDHSVPLDAETDSVIQKYTAYLNDFISAKTGGRFLHILDTVAISEFPMPDYPPLQESPLGNFITDAMRLVAWEKTGHRADFAVQANGSIRGSINPGSMSHSQGKISVYDFAEVIGLGIGPDQEAGYSVVAVYLTGEEIYRVLEVAALLAETEGNTYFLQFSGLRYSYNPDNVILFNIPFIDQPLPTTRAVTKAEMYTGEGRQGQDDDEYVPLVRDDQTLYCLVADSYIVSFLPMVGEILPWMDIVLKDRQGKPIDLEDLEQLVVPVNNDELKVWATVLEYAANQPPGPTGFPEIEAYYSSTAGRINQVWTISYITWLFLLILILAITVFLLVRYRKKIKRTKKHN